MILAAAGALAIAIGLPHVLRLDRVRPQLAVAIWSLTLFLRALTAVVVSVLLLRYVPATDVFARLTSWCLEGLVPSAAGAVRLEGHELAGAAVAGPLALLLGAGLLAGAGIVRAARRVHALCARASVGPGPLGSLVLADGGVVVGAAGLRKPKVVVSAGALLELDEHELIAGIEHERGHIIHRHRYVLVFAEFCRGFAALVPGTRRAGHELQLHLERDADEYAIARTGQPAALARVIYKAAGRCPAGDGMERPRSASLFARRLHLLGAAPVAQSATQRRLLLVAGAAMLLAGALALGTLPGGAHSGMHETAAAAAVKHC